VTGGGRQAMVNREDHNGHSWGLMVIYWLVRKAYLDEWQEIRR